MKPMTIFKAVLFPAVGFTLAVIALATVKGKNVPLLSNAADFVNGG